MTINVVKLEEFRKKKPQQEKHYKRAMTVQSLIDALGFCDRRAKVYVRNSWMVGVVEIQEYDKGVQGLPTVLLYLNQEELPRQ
jgi:hypothetical protein